jgi:type I restriction enzyme R subunit
MAPSGYTEDALVEKPTIALFRSLGWETANLYHEFAGGKSTAGREGQRDVFLKDRLRAALEKLNPDIPPDGITQAIEQLTADRGKMIPVNANQDVYQLLKSGAKVNIFDDNGGPVTETVKIIDWNTPRNNHFFLASQFWVSSEIYCKRCDLVGFVNGIPLIFMELKATHKHVKHAYDGNLCDYRSTIPHLFTPNGFIILSNGSQTRIGGTFAGWEHFMEWKKVADEKEQGIVSLDTVVRGTCTPEHLLDIVENFTVFEAGQGGLTKKVAKNHQYLGVNNVIKDVGRLKTNQGRLGVFWHTQGSGKSLSMVFLTQKILRKVPGNWTFVIVTDRKELDRQIYKTFAATGAVTEDEAHADTSSDLVQLLKEDHRYVFTLIHKFRTEKKGQTFPALSGRDDIIVITDEAHRSQYDVFALNMRNALPNAAFIGFTGTPLMAGEEKTREVFGDYVSVYNFAQSIADGATVPLYYENRIPELQLTNENLNEDMEQLLEEAELDEAQEKKLEREFAREYQLITRDDRLDTIARDLVTHFLGRGYRGKAMMICIDKATAVKMYDKVRAYWVEHLKALYKELDKASSARKAAINATIAEMGRTDMAVVVSQSQGEVEEMQRKGLDILPHRTRMVNENLDEKFKKPDDPLRLVFVCAMWITGFDVPECSTIYLDKPMRNHTLMQTIARANRVTPGKEAGLIVDYVGIFRNLQKALSIYAKPATKGGGDTPILDKQKLVEFLKLAIGEAHEFCRKLGIELGAIEKADGFQRVKLLDDAVEAIIASEGSQKTYLNMAAKIARVFRAIKPDPMCNAFLADVSAICTVGKKLNALAPPADITEVMKEIEQLLDDSIATEGYKIVQEEESGVHPPIDLSKVDFEALRKKFARQHQRTEAERLKALISKKLNEMIQQNRSRMDYLERFQKMIDAYNSGARNIEELFDELIKFAQDLTDEEQRAVREGLTEEELALFDILTKPDPRLTKKEKIEVKKIVREFLDKLKREKLVLDWYKQQRTKADVKYFIETFYDERLPDKYDKALFQDKCDLTYVHIYDVYAGAAPAPV